MNPTRSIPRSHLSPLKLRNKKEMKKSVLCKGYITRDDLHRRFLTQHIISTLLQHCFESGLCNNVPTLQRGVAQKIVVANRPV